MTQHPDSPSSDPLPTDELAEARRRLGSAESVLVLTGAGISVASGMPTFRGEDGLWQDHRPEELATPRAFERDPRLVWEWYGWRRRRALDCQPNAAHRALARWCAREPSVSLVTQNVDGLHRRALKGVSGNDPPPHAAPIELHGSLFRARCTGCDWQGPHRDEVDASDLSTLPRCAGCGELLRPAVIWFCESLDGEVLETAFGAARRAQGCLVVGTSAVVQPAASLATEAAGAGAYLVEVNPRSTPVTRVAGVSLRADAARALPALLDPLLEDIEDSEDSSSNGP